MLRLIKRLIILGAIGFVVMKVLETRSGSKPSGSASWPPIKTSGSAKS